ncbi:esterase-like activity of phytase family protein [Methylocucumis oryzae]|uniref:esterase-like activity of phytase family protein n=1 Tax=Methylocucumis oryzae TaxID=1632867 RepID=UPI000A77D56B|nr:esterase-like activity of phytase family protein [Methylocucumis oryzae]
MSFLVDERDGKGLGDDSDAITKKIFKIDLNGATDVSQIASLDASSPVVSKTLFLDLVTALNTAGISAANVPAKIEALAFGPDMEINGVTKHTLYIANDNDFLPNLTDTLHPNGVANPNQFYVFAIDTADLPNYDAQDLAVNPRKN